MEELYKGYSGRKGFRCMQVDFIGFTAESVGVKFKFGAGVHFDTQSRRGSDGPKKRS